MANVFALERNPTGTDLFKQKEAIEKFGMPSLDPKRCQVTPQIEYLECPYALRVFERTTPLKVRKLKVHKLAKPFLEAALHRTLEHYGFDKIDKLGINVFSGDFEPRMIRGSKTNWSMHSFGIAYDWLAQENGLHTVFAKSTFGRSEYKPLLDIWQECGFANLGRVVTFGRDAMHFEFMRDTDSIKGIS